MSSTVSVGESPAGNSTPFDQGSVELKTEDEIMPKNERQGARKPATKFMQLRKKMQKAKTQAKAPKPKKK